MRLTYLARMALTVWLNAAPRASRLRSLTHTCHLASSSECISSTQQH
jgi:hypothetical protein